MELICMLLSHDWTDWKRTVDARKDSRFCRRCGERQERKAV